MAFTVSENKIDGNIVEWPISGKYFFILMIYKL